MVRKWLPKQQKVKILEDEWARREIKIAATIEQVRHVVSVSKPQ